MTNENSGGREDVRGNESEHDRAQESGVHEKLCAYVLGEGTPAERAAIERDLAASPELRAQRDTIERTIGLVQSAMAGSETLSPEAAQMLVTAASSRPKPWQPTGFQAVPWLRIAAGIGAVALGFALVRESTQPAVETGRSDGSQLAKLARDERDGATLDGYDRFGKAGSAREGGAGTYGGPGDSTPPVGGRQAGSTASDLAAGVGKKAPDERPSIGLVENERKLDLTKETETVARLGVRPEVQDKIEQERSSNLDVPSSNTSAEPKSRDARAAGELAAGVDTFWLGQQQPAPSAAPVTTPPASERGQSYGEARSPGGRAADAKDQPSSKQEAMGAMRGRAGPSGPSTGGPSPASPGPSGQGDDGRRMKSVGYGSGSVPAEELAKLDEAKRRTAVNVKPSGGVTDFAELYFDDADEASEEFRRYYWQLPVGEQQAYLDRRCRRIIETCVRRPHETPRDMFFRFWGDNPFEVAALDSLSTFAADVDTASYTLARRYLKEGHVPEKAQIRTEEFVNYFDSDVPAPAEGVFAIHTDLTPSRFSTDTSRQMMRVVIRGKELSKLERKPLNLTFVVDVSGSMRQQNRLEMVKHAMRLLVTQLDAYDKIGIVKFSNDATLVLPLTPVSDRAKIEMAIEPLSPEGSTNSNAGLQLGYAVAMGGIDSNAISRVVFLSDGVANVGEKDPDKIAELVKPMREKGIYLNTIGVGMHNHNDVLLEQLADKADGMCSYIDSPEEAKRALVDRFTGAFQPIARDVKIQVEFDPRQVLRYRLLGYENRAIADADFRNDKVDAGELGAGHQVTALYEIERQPVSGSEAPLATVRLRWKDPRNFGTNEEQDAATEIAQPVRASGMKTFEEAGQGYRKAVIAAQFAEILRRSVHARGDSIDALLGEALRLQKEIPNDKDFVELVLLVSSCKDLIVRTMPACDELCQAIDEVRDAYYRRAQLEELRAEMDAKMLEDLKRQNEELEARLRELIRRRLESQGK